MSDIDAFAATWRTWELSHRTDFLRAVGTFISEIGHPDLDDRERRASLRAAQLSIAPLVLTNRSDPACDNRPRLARHCRRGLRIHRASVLAPHQSAARLHGAGCDE